MEIAEGDAGPSGAQRHAVARRAGAFGALVGVDVQTVAGKGEVHPPLVGRAMTAVEPNRPGRLCAGGDRITEGRNRYGRPPPTSSGRTWQP